MLPGITVAFLTTTDPNDKKSFSGTHYYMLQSLRKVFDEVVPLGPPKLPVKVKLAGYRQMIFSFISGKKYNTLHSEARARFYSAFFNRKLREKKYDLVIAATTSASLSYLNTEIPVIHVTDATFQGMLEYYQPFSHLSTYSRRESDNVELKSILNTSVLVYSSKWAARSAINYYGKEKDKVFWLPYGANINKAPDKKLIYLKANNKICKLLFLGVQWQRKGGDIAFDTLLELLKTPLSTQLVICGCVPPHYVKNENVRVIPYLNKNNEEHFAAFDSLMLSVNFIILPTRADCTPMVIAEAAAYGVPVITTNTGGVPDIVENGVNGFCLPYRATAKEYADKIFELFTDNSRYTGLISSGRKKYDEELNWNVWANRIEQLYETKVNTCEEDTFTLKLPGNSTLSIQDKL